MNEELNKLIAEHVFGVQRKAIEDWPWGVPDFSGDRRWAAAVATRMLTHPSSTQFDAELQRAAQVWGYGATIARSGPATMLVVLTPEEICQAALAVIPGCSDAVLT